MSTKPQSSAVKLSERHIEATCSDWLALDQWRCIKTDLPHLRGLGVQEKGMCDRLYIRYRPSFPGSLLGTRLCTRDAVVELVWIEWKRKGGKNAEHQKAWRSAERAKGALVWAAMEDFQPTIEAFQEFYRKSGLNRRL